MRKFVFFFVAILLLACHGSPVKEKRWTQEKQYLKTVGNVSFTFPGKGYAYDNRDKFAADCLKAIKSNCALISLPSYTDTITIQFVRDRQEMKKYTGLTAGGIPMIQPKIVYLVANSDPKDQPPIKHELMHMITMTTWGYPGVDSNWMNEGLAAYAENNCNGFTDEAIYRYLADKDMLVPMPALTTSFYKQPEMIAYHQAAYIVQYLLSHYGVEKLKALWSQGFASFETIYGVSFDRMQTAISNKARQDYPKVPAINWDSFQEGCL